MTKGGVACMEPSPGATVQASSTLSGPRKAGPPRPSDPLGANGQMQGS